MAPHSTRPCLRDRLLDALGPNVRAAVEARLAAQQPPLVREGDALLAADFEAILQLVAALAALVEQQWAVPPPPLRGPLDADEAREARSFSAPLSSDRFTDLYPSN